MGDSVCECVCLYGMCLMGPFVFYQPSTFKSNNLVALETRSNCVLKATSVFLFHHFFYFLFLFFYFFIFLWPWRYTIHFRGLKLTPVINISGVAVKDNQKYRKLSKIRMKIEHETKKAGMNNSSNAPLDK